MKKLFSFVFAAGLIGSLAACGGNEQKAQADQNQAGNTADAVIENIMTRTSIRQFTDQPIAKDTLDKIVRAGMAAPSAVNAQPWAFVVVTEKNVLDSLNAVHSHANLKTATAAVIVCGDMAKAMEGEGREFWVQDCSAATENILLAAHAYGIGAVWCGVYPIQERVKAVQTVLGMPENIVPLDIITMGYPAENPTPKDKFKSDNIHYQKW